MAAALVLAAAVTGALLTAGVTGKESHCPGTIRPSDVLRHAGRWPVFSADQKTLATFEQTPERSSVRLWDVRTHNNTDTLTEQEVPSNREAFSPDGRFLVTQNRTASTDLEAARTIRLRTMSTGKTIMIPTGQKAVVSVAVSPDGETLATASSWHPDEKFDNPVKLWDTDSGRNTATLTCHTNGVYGMVFSHDGKTLATVSSDNTARLWNTDTGKTITTLATAHDGLLSPDGTTIAIGSKDGTLRLQDLSSGRTILSTPVARGAVFSPDGSTFATGGEDGTL